MNVYQNFITTITRTTLDNISYIYLLMSLLLLFFSKSSDLCNSKSVIYEVSNYNDSQDILIYIFFTIRGSNLINAFNYEFEGIRFLYYILEIVLHPKTILSKVDFSREMNLFLDRRPLELVFIDPTI